MHSQSFLTHMKHVKSHGQTWLAFFIIAILYESLPKELYWGPHRLMLAFVLVSIIPLIFTFFRCSIRTYRVISLSVNSLVTIYMILSVIRIIMAVMQGHIGPIHLLSSAFILWSTNILVFALWYWNLDEGGPHQRSLKEKYHFTAFLFPVSQVVMTSVTEIPEWIKKWEPHFIDYLFLSFNTSTAFSPTDTPVLSRWAKCMSMMQALISLTIIVMLAARAINILNPASGYLVS